MEENKLIIGIHQPQYMPWIPYFQKIKASDVFVFLDSVDFQKNGLQNRNQIKTSQGAMWLTVPVKQKLGQKIIDVEINSANAWRRKHWLAIYQNYSKARFFKLYSEELEEVFNREWDKLIDLNLYLLKLQMKWLNIDHVKIVRSSDSFSKGSNSNLILNLCKEYGASIYLSGIGGKNYLDEVSFTENNIEIKYLNPILPEYYDQQYTKLGFMNNLATIDLILNYGPDSYKFIH